jgi:hypothetical protein
MLARVRVRRMSPAIPPHSSIRFDLLEQPSGCWKPGVETERIQIVPEQINELLAADLLQNQRGQRGTLQSPTRGCAPPACNCRRMTSAPAGGVDRAFTDKSRTRDIALQNPNGV